MRTPTQLRGAWRITEMELWDAEAIDLLGPAHIGFDATGEGAFQFIVVRGEIDCRFTVDDDRPRADFSWVGDDEGNPTTGRGWVILAAPDRLEGRIFFHRGDDSAFVAQRLTPPKSAPKKRR